MTLDETREAITRVKRRRRRLTAAAMAMLATSLGVGILAISRIMPLYGQWEYGNRTESRELCSLDTPAYIRLDIGYEAEPPGNIRITTSDGTWIIRDVDVADDRAAKTLSVSCDIDPREHGLGPDMPEIAYSISLVPSGNYELTYSVDVRPSYRHIDASFCFYSDKDGSMWLAMDGAYGQCANGDGMRAGVRLEGPKYAPSLYDGWIPMGSDGSVSGSLVLNLSELALWKRVDLEKITAIEAIFQCEYEDPDTGEIKSVNKKEKILLREWPAYDKDGGSLSFDMADTTEYLKSLNTRPPEGREPLDAKEPGAGQTTEQEQE